MSMIPEIFYFIYLEENAVSKIEICCELIAIDALSTEIISRLPPKWLNRFGILC